MRVIGVGTQGTLDEESSGRPETIPPMLTMACLLGDTIDFPAILSPHSASDGEDKTSFTALPILSATLAADLRDKDRFGRLY